MTIEEAIADLLSQLAVATITGHYHRANALKIGINGLKRLQDSRRDPEFDHYIPLTGETQ